MDKVTLVSSIADGASAVVGAIVTVVTKVVENPAFLTLIGLAVGYGIVKFVIHFLPMIKSR